MRARLALLLLRVAARLLSNERARCVCLVPIYVHGPAALEIERLRAAHLQLRSPDAEVPRC